MSGPPITGGLIPGCQRGRHRDSVVTDCSGNRRAGMRVEPRRFSWRSSRGGRSARPVRRDAEVARQPQRGCDRQCRHGSAEWVGDADFSASDKIRARGGIRQYTICPLISNTVSAVMPKFITDETHQFSTKLIIEHSDTSGPWIRGRLDVRTTFPSSWLVRLLPGARGTIEPSGIGLTGPAAIGTARPRRPPSWSGAAIA